MTDLLTMEAAQAVREIHAIYAALSLTTSQQANHLDSTVRDAIIKRPELVTTPYDGQLLLQTAISHHCEKLLQAILETGKSLMVNGRLIVGYDDGPQPTPVYASDFFFQPRNTDQIYHPLTGWIPNHRLKTRLLIILLPHFQPEEVKTNLPFIFSTNHFSNMPITLCRILDSHGIDPTHRFTVLGDDSPVTVAHALYHRFVASQPNTPLKESIQNFLSTPGRYITADILDEMGHSITSEGCTYMGIYYRALTSLLTLLRGTERIQLDDIKERLAFFDKFYQGFNTLTHLYDGKTIAQLICEKLPHATPRALPVPSATARHQNLWFNLFTDKLPPQLKTIVLAMGTDMPNASTRGKLRLLLDLAAKKHSPRDDNRHNSAIKRVKK